MTTKATVGETDEQELEKQFVELLDHYRGEKGALVPLLQGAQAIYRLPTRGRHAAGG